MISVQYPAGIHSRIVITGTSEPRFQRRKYAQPHASWAASRIIFEGFRDYGEHKDRVHCFLDSSYQLVECCRIAGRVAHRSPLSPLDRDATTRLLKAKVARRYARRGLTPIQRRDSVHSLEIITVTS